MEHFAATLNQVLPILLLIILGNRLRRYALISEHTVEGLKWLALNVALPSVLFASFLNLELKVSYLAVMAVIFGLCVFMYGLGRLTARVLRIDHPYFPLLVTGFEFGMLGVSLFGTSYGMEAIGYIAVIGLGHEFFIWFPFLSVLLIMRDNVRDPFRLAAAFVKAPPILAILLGVTLNLLGAREPLYTGFVLGGIMATLNILGRMTIPLILVIVGYGFRLESHGLKDVIGTVAFRMACLIPLALLLNRWFLGDLLGLGHPFQAGLFTMLILPPPFIIPLFMKPEDREERRYVNNVLTVNTVASLAVFAVFLAFNPTLK
ncbi:hypothetical protein [Pseudodesulfovibrio indicus]|uniref:AEC family transporter n=1 Tax=Pseudodesulfovibrio indicus TaxID=1716143 RepID=UPI00292E9E2A|nr:hypothetical protein [Pseudodesulfovibrio indicus]